MAKVILEITSEIPERLDLAPMQKVMAALLESDIALPGGVINVAFVDDAESQRLNREYSDNDYPTDVLSFSYIEGGGEPIGDVIGELAVSLETAERQADKAGTNLAEEVALLVLHGVLHIAGYDHQTEQEQERLQTWQQELLAKAGYRYREFVWET